MPIYLPEELPAIDLLKEENITTYSYREIKDSDFTNIGLLNLMPTKKETERDIARVLSASETDIKLTLIHIHGHTPRNTPMEYIERFYTDSSDIETLSLDGLIITGAPVEMIGFEEVGYWNELTKVIDYTRNNDIPVLYICWAAQAGLYYNHGINKYVLPKKMFGIFPHRLKTNQYPITTGCDDVINIPHSRHTAISQNDIDANGELETIIQSQEAGPYMIVEKNGKNIYVTGHIEYSADTLDKEYKRDLGKGLDIDMPKNYYEDNNPQLAPVVSWRANGRTIFCNWIKYYTKTK